MPTLRCPAPKWSVCLAFAAACLSLSTAAEAEPRIDNVSQRGLQLGGATTIVVTGAELSPAAQVWLGDEVIAVAVKDGATAERLEVEITLPRETFPGIRPLRIANESGISNAVAVVVDELPQSPWSAELAAWPVALTGTCVGATRLVTSLDGKPSQLLVLEVEARRLGSMFNPALRVLDDRGVQLAWAQADARWDGDARLSVTLPRDGRYQIELQDALFQGQAPAYFRLKITNEAAAVVPFLRGMNVAEIHSRSLNSLVGDPLLPGAWRPVRSERPSASPTGLLRLFVSPWREAVEEEDALLAGPLPVPVGINGRLGSPGEEDRYAIAAAPGSKLRIECLAERANSPLDGVLAIRDALGNQLAAADDQPGTVDPGLEFTMPDSLGTVTLALRDLRHRGGDEFRYRLAITPADAPDVRLTLDADRYLIPRGGVAIVRVHADRQAYGGPIALHFDALPAGIVADSAEIPAGANDALVTLRSLGDAAATVLQVSGEASGLTPPPIRAAQAPASAVSRFSPWLANEVAVATTPATALALAWDASSAGDALILASNTMLSAHVDRVGGATGSVRLSLLTTQAPPTKQENNQTVPDLPRTLRLAQDVVVATDQSAAQLSIAVPADLVEMPYDLALKAELLSADGSQVVATAYSPSRRLIVAKPTFALRFAGAARIVPAAADQLALELHGRVERPTGFTQPVTVKLEGLPASIPAPSVIVPEGQTDFVLTATLPTTLALGDLQRTRLTAASELAPQVTIAASNEISLSLQLGGEE